MFYISVSRFTTFILIRSMSTTRSQTTSKFIVDDGDAEMSESIAQQVSGNQLLPNKIEKIEFDGKDYPTWRFRFVSLLLGLGLLNIVEGVTDENAKGFSSRRDYVYSMLVMSMTEATIKFARDAKPGDAKKVWENLSNEYERNTRFNKISLRR